MDLLFAIAFGILLLIGGLVYAALGIGKQEPPLKEVRVVAMDRKTGTRTDGPWKPISHTGVLHEDLQARREASDEYSYSLEYR